MKESKLEELLETLTPEQASRLTAGLDEKESGEMTVREEKDSRSLLHRRKVIRVLIAAACIVIATSVSVAALQPLWKNKTEIPEESALPSRLPVSVPPLDPEKIIYASDEVFRATESRMRSFSFVIDESPYNGTPVMSEKLVEALKKADKDDYIAFTVVIENACKKIISSDYKKLMKEYEDAYAAAEELYNHLFAEDYKELPEYNARAKALADARFVSALGKMNAAEDALNEAKLRAVSEASTNELEAFKALGFVLQYDLTNEKAKTYFMNMSYGIAVFAGTKAQLLSFAQTYSEDKSLDISLFLAPAHPENASRKETEIPFLVSLIPEGPEEGKMTAELQKKFAEAGGKPIPALIVLELDGTEPDWSDPDDRFAEACRRIYHGRTEEETIAAYMEELGTDNREEAKNEMDKDIASIVQSLDLHLEYYAQKCKEIEAIGAYPQNSFEFEYEGKIYFDSFFRNVFMAEMTKEQAEAICEISGVAFLTDYDMTEREVYRSKQEELYGDYTDHEQYRKALKAVGVNLPFQRLDLKTLKKIIAEAESFEDAFKALKDRQPIPDYVGGSGVSLVEYWFDDKGSEKALIIVECSQIYYYDADEKATLLMGHY